MVLATFMVFRYPLFDKESFSAALSRVELAFADKAQYFFICSAVRDEFSFTGMALNRSVWTARAKRIFSLSSCSSCDCFSLKKFLIENAGVSIKISKRSRIGPEMRL